MTDYVKVVDGEVSVYPYSLKALRAEASFRDTPPESSLAGFGVYPVTATKKPAPSDEITKNVVEGTPAVVDGIWTQVWAEEDATADQIAVRQAHAADKVSMEAAKADNWVKAYIAMTPSELETYLTTNITDLASAKSILIKMAQMQHYLVRKALR